MSGHQGRYEMREIVNALLHQGRTGCRWDLLPHDLPPRGAVMCSFSRWRDDGIDRTIHELVRWQGREKARRDPSLVVLGTQSVHLAAGVPAKSTGCDAAKVPGHRRGLAVDGLGGRSRSWPHGGTYPRSSPAQAHRGHHRSVARRMTGGELTPGAVLARLEAREGEVAAQAEATREQIAQLTARRDELGRAAEEVRLIRKTLLELPDPPPRCGQHAAAGAARVRSDGSGHRTHTAL